MEFLQTSWTWIIEQVPILKTISSDITKLKWYELLGLIAALLAILVPIWAILKLITKPFSKKKLNPEISSSSAEEIAKAAISSYEKGKQTAEADLRQDLQARDQQITALTKAVEAMQTERQEAETEAEQTTIDTALAHLKEGNPSEAEAIFEEILETQSKHGQQANTQAAAAARHIGALAFLHDTAKAHKAYKRATELDPNDANGWNMLGHVQDRIGERKQAIKSYEKVLCLGNSTNDKYLTAIALNNLGIIFHSLGKLKEAKNAQLKSLEIHKHLDNNVGIANTYTNLGNIYLIRGDLEKALNYQLKSLTIKNQTGCKYGMANNYNNLAVIYGTCGNFEGAKTAQIKSLEINKQLENKQGIAKSYGNLGIIYEKCNEFEKAKDAQLEAFKIFEELGDKQSLAICLTNIANIYFKLLEIENAEKAQRKALEIFEQLEDKQGMANCYGNLGNNLKHIGNFKEACILWQKALDLFTEMGAKREIDQISGWLKTANCPDINKPSSN